MISRPFKNRIRKNFKVFSCALFIVFSIVAFTAYAFAIRQINLEHIEQQLTITSEAIRLHLSKEVSSELALVLKLGASPDVKAYFQDPDDKDLEEDAYEEFELFQEHIKNKTVFWVNDIDRIFHSTGYEPYVVYPENPEYYWYNLTMYETDKYNFNINYNSDMNVINLWVNVPVFDEEHKAIGILGTGIDLSEFTDFVNSAKSEYDENIASYIFNGAGEITSCDNLELISEKVLISDELGDAGVEAMRVAAALPANEGLCYVYGDNMYKVLSLSELGWYSISIYPLPGYLALNPVMNFIFFGMLSMILILFIIINFFVAKSEKIMREKNARLIEANQKAESGSRAKSNFLATMSHEIRTPMNAIIGIAQIELQKEKLPEEYAASLESIYNSSKVLLGIINDVLDMSKIETGKLELNLAEYDLPSLINDAAQVNIVRLGSKKVKFFLDVDEDLPKSLYGDELRIKQILNNLLSNAIKYTEKGHVILSANFVGLSQDGRRDGGQDGGESSIMLRFIVEDTGQGIKEEDHDKLFSEYSRFNVSTNQYIEGTGIGLSITKKLVEMMDGTIEFESEYGRGSRFVATLRQRTCADNTKIGAEVSARLRNFTFDGDKQFEKIDVVREAMPYGRVLVVDDVQTNLYVAKGMLVPYGLEIETVDSGFKAIEKIEGGEVYDIIFMDHMMPQMDGIEATKKIRELGYKGSIVALTANALVGNYEMFRQNGFDGFVPKPIDRRVLNETLNKFIRERHPENVERKAALDRATGLLDFEISARMLEVFCSDARDAAATLRKTAENGDIKLFTITAHAIKSALANIGETEKSIAAADLESAGSNNDVEFIRANAEKFIRGLEDLTRSLSAKASVVDNDFNEDKEYLRGRLLILKEALDRYDDAAANVLLEELNGERRSGEASAFLNETRDMLFLHSDFEGAAKRVKAFMDKL